MPPASPTSLQLVDLACRRGTLPLFAGVNLVLAPGHLVWLRGRNGRGKTSLLRLAAGLAAPDAGEVRWGDVPVRGNAAYRASLVHIGHANALNDDLTAAEALAFLARIHGRETSADAIDAALRHLGVATRRRAPVRTLSQGQRRRVALARLALETAAGPWLLDEPFDALDAEATQVVAGLIAAHRARGGSVLLASHLAPDGAGRAVDTLDLDRFA